MCPKTNSVGRDSLRDINHLVQLVIRAVLLGVQLLLLSIPLPSTAKTDENQTVQLSTEERAWMAAHGPVKVGAGSDWAPFDFILDSGEYGGLSWDYLQAISQLTGLEFKPEVAYWFENLEKIKKGEIDLLPATFETEGRKTYLNFSSPYYKTVEYFFIRDDVKAKTASDMNGLTVAIPKGFAHIEYIQNYYPDIKILKVDTVGDAIDAVIQGKAELLYETYVTIDYMLDRDGINEIRPFLSNRGKSSETVSIATRRDLPHLHSIINKGLAALGYEKRKAIDQRWLIRPSPDDKGFTLSAEEKKWLSEHSGLRLGGDPNWLPFEAFDKNGQYIGIVSDYFALIEQRLGMSFERVETNTWLETIEYLEEKKIDIISETYASPLSKHVVFTKSYLSSPIVIIMDDSAHYVEDISQIRRKKIALIEDYGYVEEIKRKYPLIPFHSVPDIQTGLTNVSTGKLDALVATLSQASYHISDLGIHNVRIVGQTEFKTNLAFGVRKEFAELVPIINRAIDSISAAERQEVIDTWGREKFASRVDYSYVWRVILIALVIFIVILLWNRKLAKEILLRRQAEDQMQALINNIPAQVFVTDLKGQVLTSNAQFDDDYRFTPEELEGFDVDDLYTDLADRQEITDVLMSGDQVKNKLIKLQRKGQRKIHSLMLSVIPIRYNNKSALLAIAVDMNERLEIEEQLRSAKEAAEVATKSKSEFLANVSHEIRTPMNAIIGFTELLEKSIEDEKLKSYVKTIQSSSNNLLLIVNDVLDISKIEAGAIQLNNSPANLKSLFDEFFDIFKLSIRKKGLRMYFDISPDIPKTVLIDLPRLRQVLINLIGNAIKFTDSGHVKLSVAVDEREELDSRLDIIIEVEDTGIGIPEDQVSSVFEKFQQVNDESNLDRGGTGLGLSICQRLVTLMGGSLSLKSVYGKGTTVTVHLADIEVLSIDALPDDKSTLEGFNGNPDFNKATVLVVDDIDINRSLVMETLGDTNLHFIEAGNGEEAILKNEQNEVDLILMDLRMPVMNGYRAAEVIKEKGSDTPIVALTASVMNSDLNRINEAYFDGYIRKPVTKRVLVQKLVEFLPCTVEERVPAQELQSEAALRGPISTALREALVSMRGECAQMLANNNLSETASFAERLLEVAEAHDNDYIADFAHTLKANVESFNVVGVEEVLSELKAFMIELEA